MEFVQHLGVFAPVRIPPGLVEYVADFSGNGRLAFLQDSDSPELYRSEETGGSRVDQANSLDKAFEHAVDNVHSERGRDGQVLALDVHGKRWRFGGHCYGEHIKSVISERQIDVGERRQGSLDLGLTESSLKAHTSRHISDVGVEFGVVETHDILRELIA